MLDDLGRLRSSTGDLAGAEEVLRRSLALRERVYGPAHPRVAVVLHHLSFSRLAAGDSAGAEALARRALAILEVSSGPEHRRTADARMDLALALALSGRAAEAIPIAARAADAQDRDARLVLATGSEAQKRAIAAGLAPSTDALISLHLDRAPADPGAARLALTAILRRKGACSRRWRAASRRCVGASPCAGARCSSASRRSRPTSRRGSPSRGRAPRRGGSRPPRRAGEGRQQIEAEISALSGVFQAEEGLPRRRRGTGAARRHRAGGDHRLPTFPARRPRRVGRAALRGVRAQARRIDRREGPRGDSADRRGGGAAPRRARGR